MMVRRGKLVGLGAVGLGIVVVLIAAFASRRLLLEEWHLSRLASTDQQTRKNAAQALGEYGSVRSVPLLMKANSLTLLLQDRRSPDALVSMEKNFAVVLDQQVELENFLDRVDQKTRQMLKYKWAALDMRLANLAAEVSTVLDISPYRLSLTRIVAREKKAAVPYLSVGLQEDHWRARWLAVQFLGSLGSDAETAVPVLETKTKDPNGFVRYAALCVLRALRNAGNPERGGAE